MKEQFSSASNSAAMRKYPAAERNLKIDVLRIAACLAVITIHAFGTLTGTPQKTISWQISSAITSFMVWAVPIFVMISGAFCLRPEAWRKGDRNFLSRRVNRIIPGMLFWFVFYYTFYLTSWQKTVPNFPDFLETAIWGRIAPHLYFLWLILGLYVISPILIRLIHQRWDCRQTADTPLSNRRLVTVVLPLTVVFMAVGYLLRHIPINVKGTELLPSYSYTWWVFYIGYFLAGWLIIEGAARVSKAAVGNPTWILRLRIARWVAIAIAIVALGMQMLMANGLINSIPFVLDQRSQLSLMTILACLALFFAIVLDIPRSRQGEQQKLESATSSAKDKWTDLIVTLSDATMFVYLAHFFILVELRPYLPYSAVTLRGAALGMLLTVLISFALGIFTRRVKCLRFLG